MVRLMSTSSAAAASEAKDEAAKASKEGGDKKAVVINSYWGIEQNNKLVRDDGNEWKWTCFRVRALRLPLRFDHCSVYLLFAVRPGGGSVCADCA